MKTSVVLLCVLAGALDAAADSEDAWPLHHEVLGHQRQLPCKETWKHGASDAVSYAMTFTRAGQLVRRDDDSGTWKRYRHDNRGRIVAIDGASPGLMSKFVTTVRYNKRGLASIKTRNTTEISGVRLDGSKPKFRQSTFELTWKYDGNDTVRLTAAINGAQQTGPDIAHYERGRLISTDLDIGDVVTAAYDANGRLESMTTAYQGKPSAVTRYTYDAGGRLEREDFDRDLDGVVDQSHAYSYDCAAK